MKFTSIFPFALTLSNLVTSLPLGYDTSKSTSFNLQIQNSSINALNGEQITRRFASNRPDSELGYFPGEEIGFSGYITDTGRFELESITGPQSVCIDDSLTLVPNHVAYIREGTESKSGFAIQAGGLLSFRNSTLWLLCHNNGVYALVTGESNCDTSDIYAKVELVALNNEKPISEYLPTTTTLGPVPTA
ncbi:hypothetical protein BABINDRAFT_159654 [Babjeviella inositovora NRRL Y-12698]|uniref:Uncharacterized protein n=1 Tax=Babjeviella inositovora NRRL Y-12698 TaxID=984486 RepID=A0A1E3R036_9ASCO|nr:uncharacterized protein BABINDRAFT_159654 [Babjeviella inositovora NRRL Y-12698]ODQ83215.1 hypothetical protein BABINDRAFT_159654 [Babjeviella inositovora NRRL Y-12698]